MVGARCVKDSSLIENDDDLHAYPRPGSLDVRSPMDTLRIQMSTCPFEQTADVVCVRVEVNLV